jgi:hypothetical protein
VWKARHASRVGGFDPDEEAGLRATGEHRGLGAVAVLLDLLVGVGWKEKTTAAPARGNFFRKQLPGSHKEEVGVLGSKLRGGALGGTVALLIPASAVQAASILDGGRRLITLVSEKQRCSECGERAVGASAGGWMEGVVVEWKGSSVQGAGQLCEMAAQLGDGDAGVQVEVVEDLVLDRLGQLGDFFEMACSPGA